MKLVLLAAAVLGVTAASAALPFKAGERIVFLGDSITRGGHHLRVIEDYVLTRYPGADIRFRNAGVGGDTAAACASRVADDVIAFSPAWVVVMFGMNDIARGCYVAEPTQQQINSRTWALGNHRDSMTGLSTRFRDEIPGVNLIWCTPSPYDENVVYSPPVGSSVGADAALETCSVFVRGLAAEKGDRLVEFHSTMNAYNALRQQSDPSFTLCGTDRIHPGKEGGLYMGWRFLMDMGADALVSSVTVAADSGICTASENATVTDVKTGADCVTFTVHEKALPFPVDPEAAGVAATLPLADDLNREIVKVTGLPRGVYTLSIDGKEADRRTADEWAQGVNLAFNSKTPQFKLSKLLSARNGVRNQNESDLRILHMIRWWLGRSGITNVDDFDEIRAKRSSLPQTGFYAEHIDDYLEKWPQHQRMWQAVEDEWTVLVEMAKTEPHVYTLEKVVQRPPRIVTEGEHAVTASVSPSTGSVRIAYRLADEPAVVTAVVRLNGEPVAASTFGEPTGEIHCLVPPGDHVGHLPAIADWPGRTADPSALSVELKAWPAARPPDYLVADLASGKVRYYVSEGALPFGVASDLYRSTRYAMRRVPAAGETFRMGSPLNESGRTAANEAAHNETLEADFYMGVFETTIGQYTNVLPSATGYTARPFDCPVNNVAYNALYGGDGLLTCVRSSTGIDFDLPTEVQWEFACRAGSRAAFCDGTDTGLDGCGWYADNSGYKPGNVFSTHRVGTKAANAFGLYDLHGNLYEHCRDWFEMDVKRVYRGGSFGADLKLCRSAWRSGLAPTGGHAHIGFRLVCPAIAK